MTTHPSVANNADETFSKMTELPVVELKQPNNL